MGIMEEKIKTIREDMADLRFKKGNIRDCLQKKNKKLKSQLQEKEEKIATMTSLSMEFVHFRHPSKSYSMFLKDQWCKF